MSSFDSQPLYQGLEVWDCTDVWWARDPESRQIWWAFSNGRLNPYTPAPWDLPVLNRPDGLEPDFEGAIGKAGGVAFDLYPEDEVELPEGVAFKNDPQVGVGLVWSLFDPAKEIT